MSVLILKLFQPPQFANTERLRNPISRMTSVTGMPVSACFSAKAIHLSVYRDFFFSSFLPEGFTKPENAHSK